MQLIVKGKPIRQQCEDCGKLCETASKGQREVYCHACQESMLDEILTDYREQIENGIPRGERWVTFPISRVHDLEFDRKLRESISEMDRALTPTRTLVAM